MNSPPCQEVIISGDELRRPGGGLASLPVPISTPGFDSAPYLTATLCITRDPETGVRNMGTYRAALKKTDRLGVRMSSRIGGAGGYLHWLKYRDRREPMPCAIVMGCAPVVIYTGPQKLPINLDEMTVAGGVAGAPIRTAKCVTIDLEVPADAEIVIEGLIDSDLLEPEGPFGESNGYVALEDYNMIMQVTAITHRRNAGFPLHHQPGHAERVERDQESGVRTDVPGASAGSTINQRHPPRRHARAAEQCSPRHFPAIRQRHAAHRGLARNARRRRKQADCGKIVIAVSEDIDPANTDAVLWSLAYRSNPVEDVHIEPYRSPGPCAKIRAASDGLDDADRRNA